MKPILTSAYGEQGTSISVAKLINGDIYICVLNGDNCEHDGDNCETAALGIMLAPDDFRELMRPHISS